MLPEIRICMAMSPGQLMCNELQAEIGVALAGEEVEPIHSKLGQVLARRQLP